MRTPTRSILLGALHRGVWLAGIPRAGAAIVILAVTAAVGPLVLAGAGQAVAGTRVPAGAGAPAPGGNWHVAVQVPGTAVVGNVDAESVSCGSAGNCSAGGTYTDGSFHGQAFVVVEANGRWATAIEVPGTAALNKGAGNPDNANAGVISVSCRQAARCTALGWYTDRSGYEQAFVASES